MLAMLVDACEGQKGGKLISTVNGYEKHGDPMVQDIVAHIMKQVPWLRFLLVQEH